MKTGLRKTGSKDSDGKEIKVRDGHIPDREDLGDIENWAKAIFVSPSVFYSADKVYSEEINTTRGRFKVLVEAWVRPDAY